MNGIKNVQMKSWMSSAFSSSNEENKVPSKATRASAIKRSAVAKSPPRKPKLLIAEKYAPQTKADLVVNKAKVEQLSSLLDTVLGKPKGSIVIIEGPPGCGKQTTLQLLCKEKGVEVVQWDQPNTALKRFDNNNDMEYVNDPDWQNNPYESQTKVFANFLFKSSRYMSQIFNDVDQPSQKKILFLKDIPMFAFRDIKSFQQLLGKFMNYSKSALFFSLSNSPMISNEFNPIKIFTADFRKELGILEIGFNAIANSYISKHLEKIIKQEIGFSGVALGKNFLEEVCLVSDGDLRQALNILELAQHNPKSDIMEAGVPKKIAKITKSSGKTTKQKHTTRQEPSDNSLVQMKDANFSIFRGLGKVLHRKNMETTDSDPCFATEQLLPAKLKSQQRPPLFYDPDDVLAKTPIGEELITLYLHQNYIELYAIKSANRSFNDTFETLNSLNENFMSADMTNKKFNHNPESNKGKESTALLSIRSVLFHTYIPDEEKAVKKPTSTGRGMWMPLHKPYSYKVKELSGKKKANVYDMLLDNNDPLSIQLATYLVEMQSEFFTTILPFAAKKKSRTCRELATVDSALGRGQFKFTQGVTMSNENDPSFFMDDQEQLHGTRKQAKTGSKNFYDYEDDENLNIE